MDIVITAASSDGYFDVNPRSAYRSLLFLLSTKPADAASDLWDEQISHCNSRATSILDITSRSSSIACGKTPSWIEKRWLANTRI